MSITNEFQQTDQLKHWEYNYKDEDKSENPEW